MHKITNQGQHVMNRIAAAQWCTLFFIFSTMAHGNESAAPQITKLDKNEVYANQSLFIHGTHLKTEGIQLQLGNKKLPIVQQDDKFVVVIIPPGAKTGNIQLRHGRTKQKLQNKLMVLKTPWIKKFPPQIPSTGNIVVKGKNLNLVAKWMLGKFEAPIKKKTKQKVTLMVKELPIDDFPVHMVLENGVELRPEPSIKSEVVLAPEIEAVGYMSTTNKMNTTTVWIAGRNFTSKTTVQINKKRATVERFEKDRTYLLVQYKGKLPKKKIKLQAANGMVSGEPYWVNGKAGGMQLTTQEVQKALKTEPVPLSKARRQMEFAFVAEQINNTMGGVSPLKNDVSAKTAKKRGADSAVIFEMMKRLRVLQGSVCAAMEEGVSKGPNNAEYKELLEATTQYLQRLSAEGLMTLWKGTPGGVLKKHHKKLGVAGSARAIEDLVESRFLPWRACYKKVYGAENKSAEELVRQELEHNFWDAYTALFENLIQETPKESAFRKQLKKIFRPLGKEQKDFWTNKMLDAHKRRHSAAQLTID